jgi:flagellum-specific ATP synthase
MPQPSPSISATRAARAADHGFADALRHGPAGNRPRHRRTAGDARLSAFGVRPPAALVERAGNGPSGGGSITAFYTVLTEGDDQQDPIADAARAILDGHIVLSRSLADAGHYPAIDIEQSISRAMTQLIDQDQFELARQFKQLYSRYARARDLIAVGAYSPGSDQLLDRAIGLFPRLEAFLQQPIAERADSRSSREQLRALFA